VNEVAKEFETADGIICASPVYFANVNGNLLSFLQRLFYSTSFDKSMKVGSGIVCARRSGTTASFDEINRFCSIKHAYCNK
jgi:Multimeric flavodoxin WrbA